MRRSTLIMFLLLGAFFWGRHLMAENSKPSKVTVEHVQVGDSVAYVVKWTEPIVGKKQLPIVKYEVQLFVLNQDAVTTFTAQAPAVIMIPALPVGDTVRGAIMRVRSVDKQGNVSTWAESPKFNIFSEIVAPNPPSGVTVEPAIARIWLVPDDTTIAMVDGVIHVEPGDSFKFCALIQYENGARGLDSTSVGWPGCEQRLRLWNQEILHSLVQSLA